MSLIMSATNRIQKPNPHLILNLALEKSRANRMRTMAEPLCVPQLEARKARRGNVAETSDLGVESGIPAEKPIPLGLVLKACPDISNYAKGEIASWRDLMAAAVAARAGVWRVAERLSGRLRGVGTGKGGHCHRLHPAAG